VVQEKKESVGKGREKRKMEKGDRPNISVYIIPVVGLGKKGTGNPDVVTIEDRKRRTRGGARESKPTSSYLGHQKEPKGGRGKEVKDCTKSFRKMREEKEQKKGRYISYNGRWQEQTKKEKERC